MAASFPENVKTFVAKTDGVDDVLASHVNDMQNEITAIETELGTGTSGASFDTVRDALIDVENRITAIEDGSMFVRDTYTPIWVAATSGTSVGNGTLVGEYIVRGDMCLLNITLTFGATTNGGVGNWSFSLPYTSYNGIQNYLGVCHIRDAGANNYERFAEIAPDASIIQYFIGLDNATNLNTLDRTTPFAWGSGDTIIIQIEYRIASP